MDKIGVGYASVTDIEKKNVMDALDSQRLSQGKYVAKFEKMFANMHGHKYGVMWQQRHKRVAVLPQILCKVQQVMKIEKIYV